MPKTRKIAVLGLLTALCFALSYAEFLLPAPAAGLPGIKLGLANICVLAALYLFGFWEAAAVNLARIVLSWLIFGSFSGFLYSLAGGILSILTMGLLKKSGKFSPIGVSAAGGSVHNLGQLAVAGLMTDASVIWYYGPVLLVVGCLSGILNGAIAAVILKRVKGKE